MTTGDGMAGMRLTCWRASQMEEQELPPFLGFTRGRQGLGYSYGWAPAPGGRADFPAPQEGGLEPRGVGRQTPMAVGRRAFPSPLAHYCDLPRRTCNGEILCLPYPWADLLPPWALPPAIALAAEGGTPCATPYPSCPPLEKKEKIPSKGSRAFAPLPVLRLV